MKIHILLLTLLILTLSQDNTYTRYYDECKKIVSGMTIQQKIGQTLQVDFNAITNSLKQQTDPNQAVSWGLGGLTITGDTAPTTNGNIARMPSSLQVDKLKQYYLQKTSQNWKKLLDRFKDLGVEVTTKDKQKYKIKFFTGTDAVHGDQNTLGTMIFPHNIGLSMTHNQTHFNNMGFWTKDRMKKTGFNMAYAPNVAVSHNPQWGRFYESLGQQDDYIYKYGQSFVKGLMDVNNGKVNGVLGSAKSFFGDGATRFGANEGSASVINFKPYLQHNSPGYKGAIASSLGSVIISHSSINLVPNVYESYLKLGYLREQLGFSGFTMTDYDQIRRVDNEFLPRTFFNVTEQEGYAMIVNGGTDMLMLSGEKLLVERIIKHGKKAIQRKEFLEKRLEQSVVRILSVKMAMGLVQKVSGIEQPIQLLNSQPQLQLQTSSLPTSSNQYQDSLNAVHESLVLLKNDNQIPVANIKSSIEYIVLIGEKIHNLNGLTKIQLFRNFDSIGMQCGGWTVRWQGSEGNDFWDATNKDLSNASSILDALKLLQKNSKFQIIYPQYSSFTNELTINSERTKFLSDLKTKSKNFNSRNTLIIGSFGEFPYAETVGDVNIPYCKHFDDPGCLYRTERNPYAPGSQLKTLEITFSTFQKQVIDTVRAVDKNIPLISVLFSGRPMLIEKIMTESQAFIASWLPGTSGGQGVVNAITGEYIFRRNGSNDRRNTLSVDWPKTMQTLQNFPLYTEDETVPKINNALFNVGYGLSSGSQLYDGKSLIRQE